MKMSGNTILITGGGSGIGRGLAEAFHAQGNQVILAGRRQQALEEVAGANPGMKTMTLDITDAASLASFVSRLTEEAPALNVVINNAGIMRAEDVLTQGTELKDAEAIIATNLLGPIRLTAALLPTLRKQQAATIMMVSSGLAFVPMAMTPTYCATKAAIHSYSESLRYQMQGTTVEVVELVPPYVQTDLMGGAEDPRAMPLSEYIAEVMEILQREPGAAEICVERVKALRLAEASGKYQVVFKGMNDAMSAAMKQSQGNAQ